MTDITRVQDIPIRYYKVTLSDKSSFFLEEERIEKLIASDTQQVVIRDDQKRIVSVINRAFIVSIYFNKALTKEKYLQS